MVGKLFILHNFIRVKKWGREVGIKQYTFFKIPKMVIKQSRQDLRLACQNDEVLFL